MQQTEKQLEKLALRKTAIEEQLGRPELLNDNKKLTELQRELGKITKDLAAQEAQWIDAQQQVENALSLS